MYLSFGTISEKSDKKKKRDSDENQKMLNLVPKMPNFPHLRYNKNPIDAYLYTKNQEKVTSQSLQNGVTEGRTNMTELIDPNCRAGNPRNRDTLYN